MAMRDGYALEHRYVLHEAGVVVPRGCHVHHINGDKTDNRRENLEVKTETAHHRDHVASAGAVENQFGRFAVRASKSCEKCGKPFVPWTSRGRFCSRVCANSRSN